MGQDFTKGLNVCIGNYGYYNEGSLHDAWITLPKTEAEIRDFLHLNQLQDSQHEEIYISDYDGIPFGTRLLFNEFCHLEDLNLLAKQLVTANPADLEKVGAWIQANDTPESLVGLMNLIEQADDIPFYSWGYDGAYDKDEFGNMIYTTMSPERNYGYEMVEQNEELKHILDSSSQIESAFDYEKYGRAYTEGGEVTVLEDGYIDNCAVQSVADCSVLFIPFFKPGIFQIEIPGERHLIQAQQLIRFDSASIHYRTSPERQEVPFTLFACLKLSLITVKPPISLFFFVRFYHLSSKKGHP